MDFLSSIGETVSSIGDKIIELLPRSPISFIDSNPQIREYISFMNWFIPVDTMIAMTEAWLTAIVIYYVVQIILRWAKIVE